MTDHMNRRGFLAASAVLSAGVLVLPAKHADAMPDIRPASDAELWAILDRRISEQHHTSRACRCHDCEAIRAKPFTCGACGFRGEPIVFPCDCGEQWDETVSSNAEMIRDKTIAQTRRREIAAWQRKLLTRGRYPMCSTADPMCAHGSAVCPACGDTGSDDPFDGDEEPREVAAMLRRPAGRAPGSSSDVAAPRSVSASWAKHERSQMGAGGVGRCSGRPLSNFSNNRSAGLEDV
jgi:hypothetical protein